MASNRPQIRPRSPSPAAPDKRPRITTLVDHTVAHEDDEDTILAPFMQNHTTVQFHHEEEEEDDEDAEFNYHIRMMNTTPVSKTVTFADPVNSAETSSIPEPCRVLIDSGANICCTPPTIVHHVPNLTVYQWRNLKTVTFGNGTTAVSKYYVNLGPILGNTAILSSLSNTIMAVPRVNKRGFSVACTWDMTCEIRSRTAPDTVLTAPLDGPSHLYYMNVSHLLAYPTDPVATVSVLRKRQPVSAVALRQALELHANLNHAASAAVMARAIRTGAWPGVSLDPTVVEQLYLHQDCLACLLGKMNRLPRSIPTRLLCPT